MLGSPVIHKTNLLPYCREETIVKKRKKMVGRTPPPTNHSDIKCLLPKKKELGPSHFGQSNGRFSLQTVTDNSASKQDSPAGFENAN